MKISALVLSALAAPCVFAATVLPGVSGGVTATLNNTPLAFGPTFLDTGVLALPQGSFQVVGSADYTYGTLKTSVTATSSGGALGALAGIAYASSTDMLTIASPDAADGSTGYLTVKFHLDGTIQHSGAFDAVAGIVATVNGFVQEGAFDSSVSGDYEFPVPFQFTYGTPIDFQLQMSSAAGAFRIIQTGFWSPAGSIIDAVPVPTTQPGSGSSQFGNTFVLTGLDTFDSNLDPVTTATFGSSSGAHYTADGVVPEPSTAVLAALGLGGVAFLASRRRARVSSPR